MEDLMSRFEIKHRFTESLLFSLECETMKICVQTAVNASADLSRAHLSGADLSGATYGKGVPITNPPIQILGSKWPDASFIAQRNGNRSTKMKFLPCQQMRWNGGTSGRSL